MDILPQLVLNSIIAGAIYALVAIELKQTQCITCLRFSVVIR